MGAVIAVLSAAVWLGGRWGRAQDGSGPVSAVVAVAAAPSTGTTTAPVPPAGPSAPPPSAPAPPAPEDGPPEEGSPEDAPASDVTQQTPAATDLAGWRDLVQSLYDRRAAAFTEGRPELFAQVYAAGSDLGTRDRAEVAALVTGSRQVRGFAPTVDRVDSVTVDGDRAQLSLADSFADYRVVPAGDPAATGRTVGGRAETGVTMDLVRTPSGWRLDSARLVL
jgi:hypothetical protein